MSSEQREVATLGGGCFWCLEAVFDRLRGVVGVVSGYAGGSVDDPSYGQVCRGDTGHAEVAQVTFDPRTITYRQILEVFFGVHDPTTLNRQGGDVGTQYRSVIFYHDSRQKEIAEMMIQRLDEERLWSQPIVTEVAPLETFYAAEPYHQEYYRKNPGQPYCRMTIAPKVAKLRKQHSSMLKEWAQAAT
ncbi:MAG: peptide-methionine (S)-S-oxide reductase MsrA [Anaerolineae bacterium]|jgi:peptide-methionine (S)-S-oxide reductase